MLARRDQESEDAAAYVQDLSARPDSFKHWDRELLVHLCTEAAVHIRRLESEVQSMKATIGATEELRRKFAALLDEHETLQEAHLAQAKQVRKLEAKVSKMSQMEQTIKMQENVIARMQAVLEAQLQAKPATSLTSKVALSKSLPSRKQVCFSIQKPLLIGKSYDTILCICRCRSLRRQHHQ
jgi:predicted RNase H-like nuclease (RuvC/YqgF family)